MTKHIVTFDGIGEGIITDKTNIIHHSKFDTDITLKNLETGEIIAKSLKNKIILPGAGFIARSLFDIGSPEVIPTYNDALGIVDPAETGNPVDFSSATADQQKVILFCIGTNGCGTEGSHVYDVAYNSWIDPNSIIPFRYPLSTNDLGPELRQSYFGRKEDGDYVAYYFKRFTSGPDLHQQYLDGTPISSDVLDTGEDVETYIETILTITKDDCREFFIATTGIDECRFNSISLCCANAVDIGGIPYFKNIRPMTRINIPNEYLIDVTKGVEIIYHTYI